MVTTSDSSIISMKEGEEVLEKSKRHCSRTAICLCLIVALGVGIVGTIVVVMEAMKGIVIETFTIVFFN